MGLFGRHLRLVGRTAGSTKCPKRPLESDGGPERRAGEERERLAEQISQKPGLLEPVARLMTRVVGFASFLAGRYRWHGIRS